MTQQETFDVVQERVFHRAKGISGIYTARQDVFAGYVPLLRDQPRCAKYEGMNPSAETKISALKRAIIESTGPGKKWSRRGLSLAVGGSPDLVRNILSGKSLNPAFDTVVNLANAMGVDPATFVSQPANNQIKVKLPVMGVVSAGVWRVHWETPEDSRREIEVGPSPVPGIERFAVHLEGESMNKVIPSGYDLECLRVWGDEIVPVPGDIVIVERRAHDMMEVTCKRLVEVNGERVLKCESNRPEFQDVIKVGSPSEDLFVDDEVRIIGIVVSAQLQLFRRF